MIFSVKTKSRFAVDEYCADIRFFKNLTQIVDDGVSYALIGGIFNLTGSDHVPERDSVS